MHFVKDCMDEDLFSAIAEFQQHGRILDRPDLDVKDILNNGKLIIEKKALDKILRDRSRDLPGPPPKATYLGRERLSIVRKAMEENIDEKLSTYGLGLESLVLAFLQVDVYCAPVILAVTGYEERIKQLWSPIRCTLIQGLTSAVLVNTPTTAELAEGLSEWVTKTAPGKKLKYIYTTHAHGAHFFGNSIILKDFPEAKSVPTSFVVDGIKEALTEENLALWKGMFPGQLPDGQVLPEALPANGQFSIDGHSLFANTPEKRKHWLDALDQIAALEPSIVVPGHKRVSQLDGPYLIDLTKDYIHAFEEELTKWKDADDVEEAMKKRYPHRWNEFILSNSCTNSVAKLKEAEKKSWI
ncbi:Hypothetical protein PENO1_107680 [Penicillium occitanis (nom. inval.)]|nr:Hypothetical protein PENO1_107680 [Penicillium occitanis (nom. inval.)]